MTCKDFATSRTHYLQTSFFHRIAVIWVAFEFWKQPKVTVDYVGTLRRLSTQYDTVFTQKLLHKIRLMRWRVIVAKKPVTAHTRVIPKILFKISHTIFFGIPRSFSSSRTVSRRSPSIASCTHSILFNIFVVEGQPERESLSIEVRPPLNDYTTLLFAFCA